MTVRMRARPGPDRVLLVVGDLHLTDGTLLDHPFHPDGVQAFEDVVMRAAERTGGERAPVDVLFLGDGVDILRSRRWEGKLRPWHDPKDGVVPEIEALVEEIVRRNRPLLARMRNMLRGTGGRVMHLYGNHDRHLAFCPGARAHVSAALTGDPAKVEFMEEVRLPEFRLYAQHGHRQHPILAEDAVADAFQVELVNRYPQAVADELGGGPDLAQELHLLNFVLPRRAAVDYIMVQVRKHGGEKRFKEVWNGLVDEFLAQDLVKDWLARTAKRGKRLRREKLVTLGLRASAMIPLSWVFFLRRFFYNASALETQHEHLAHFATDFLARKENQDLDYVASGHTHISSALPVGRGPRGDRYYLNPGLWCLRMLPTGGRKPDFYRQEELSFVLLVRGAPENGGSDGAPVRFALHRRTSGRIEPEALS